ncbi:MAG: nucleotide exchange factor GrpE [Candidatus Paceibacterota bacterium]
MGEGDEGVLEPLDYANERSSVSYLEDLQRVMAEYANYRKRSLRDIEGARAKGRSDVLLKLIEVRDNVKLFEDNSGDLFSKSIGERIDNVLSSFGVVCYGSVGDEFDYNLHDAVDAVDDDEHADRLVKVLESGYYFEGDVLRICKVVVGRRGHEV